MRQASSIITRTRPCLGNVRPHPELLYMRPVHPNTLICTFVKLLITGLLHLIITLSRPFHLITSPSPIELLEHQREQMRLEERLREQEQHLKGTGVHPHLPLPGMPPPPPMLPVMPLGIPPPQPLLAAINMR